MASRMLGMMNIYEKEDMACKVVCVNIIINRDGMSKLATDTVDEHRVIKSSLGSLNIVISSNKINIGCKLSYLKSESDFT